MDFRAGAQAAFGCELLSPRLLRAYRTAATAHAGQVRKGTDVAYIIHPCAVMYVASQQTLPTEIREDVLVACLLHDVLEDAPERVSAEQLGAEFGDRVSRYVRQVTKDSSLPDWELRTRSYLVQLESAEVGAVVVAACDKLHNLSEILLDYEEEGEKLWARFKRGKSSQQWWYAQVYGVVEKRCPELELLPEYRRKLDRLCAI